MCMYETNKNMLQRKGSILNDSLIFEVVIEEAVKILKIERKMEVSLSVSSKGKCLEGCKELNELKSTELSVKGLVIN